MIDTALFDKLRGDASADDVAQLVVGAVICASGRVLLLQRSAEDFMGGIFELPSGKVEPGEPLDAALMREVKEETGLHIASIDTYLGHFDYTSGSGQKSRQFNFAVTVTTADPVTLTEHDAYTWIGPTDPPPVTEAVQNILTTHRTRRGI